MGSAFCGIILKFEILNKDIRQSRMLDNTKALGRHFVI